MELGKLINDLSAPVEADRQYAAEDLGAVNDAAAVAALADRLAAESSRAVKEAIFLALGRIHDDSVIPAAIALLDAEDAFIRNEAVHLLGARGAKAVPALARALDSDNCDLRKFALDAIATIDSDLRDEIYRKVLDDVDINLVITAVEYIGRENRTVLRERVQSVLEGATHPMLIAACIEALGQIGDTNSLDAMYRKLGGDRIAEFLAPGFIRALGCLGVGVHAEMLCRLTERFPATLVDAGLDAIENIRQRVSLPSAPPALLAAVRNIVKQPSNPLARYKAVQALGAFADEGARDSIRQYLESGDKLVRLAAVESVSHWDIEAAKDLLKIRQRVETDEDVLAAIHDAVNQQSRNAA